MQGSNDSLNELNQLSRTEEDQDGVYPVISDSLARNNEMMATMNTFTESLVDFDSVPVQVAIGDTLMETVTDNDEIPGQQDPPNLADEAENLNSQASLEGNSNVENVQSNQPDAAAAAAPRDDQTVDTQSENNLKEDDVIPQNDSDEASTKTVPMKESQSLGFTATLPKAANFAKKILSLGRGKERTQDSKMSDFFDDDSDKSEDEEIIDVDVSAVSDHAEEDGEESDSFDSTYELPEDDPETILQSEKAQLHPSQFYRVYENSRDSATQTGYSFITPGQGGLELPSQVRRRGPEFLQSLGNDDDIEVKDKIQTFKQTTMGRRAIRKSMEALNEVSIEKTAEITPKKPKIKNFFEIDNKRARMTKVRRLVYDYLRKMERRSRSLDKRWGIWNGPLRTIESRFGTGIAKYFSLYRWVFGVNLFLLFIWFLFVILFGFIESTSDNFKGWQDMIFSGGQALRDTIFFIGGYTPVVFKNNATPYYMNFAYLAVIVFTFLISFVLILRRMKQSYMSAPKSSHNVGVDQVSPFANLTFTAWDYALAEKSALNRHKSAIVTTYKALISKIEVQEKKKMLQAERFQLIIRRILTNLFVLVIWFLSAVLIWLTLLIEFSLPSQVSNLLSIDIGFVEAVQSNNFVSITSVLISVLNVVYPYFFHKIAKFEMYPNPSFAANITLARSFVTKIAAIYVILISFYISSRFVDIDWEHAVGESIYQLIWVNMVFTIMTTLGYGFVTKLFRGKEKYEFPVADNILDIIYRQALLWVGCVYSPMTVLTSVIAGVVIFYVKKFTLVTCGLPPRRIYNSYSQNIYFLSFLLLTLIMVSLPVFFSIVTFRPTNGPFENLSSMYSLIPRTIESFGSKFFRELFLFIGSFGFVVPVGLILIVWIYYLRAANEKRIKMIKLMSQELQLERADKRFLLRYYKVKM